MIEMISNNDSGNILNDLYKRKRLLEAGILNSPSKDEILTPVLEAEREIDILPNFLWKNPNIICGDICSRSGVYPLLMIIKFMENLPIEDETFRYNHIINNMIKVYVNHERNKWLVSKIVYGDIGKSNLIGILLDDAVKKGKISNMPNFDVAVINPPYKNTLNLDFLKLSYKISKRFVVCVHPAVFVLDEKGKEPKYEEIKKLIGNNIVSLTFFNGNPVFNLGLAGPLSITFVDKDFDNKGKILINDKIKKTEILYENINMINKWSDNKIYPELKKKILELCKKDNFLNHRNKKEGDYYINPPLMTGRTELTNSGKLFQDHFFAAATPKTIVETQLKRRKWGKSHDFFFSFPTEEGGKNSLGFLKTRWGMFCLSILKNSQNLNRGEFASVPWLDWSQSWTEEKFEKLINATPEEIAFVKENIPDYYGISK